jgi:hypothetical protein
VGRRELQFTLFLMVPLCSAVNKKETIEYTIIFDGGGWTTEIVALFLSGPRLAAEYNVIFSYFLQPLNMLWDFRRPSFMLPKIMWATEEWPVFCSVNNSQIYFLPKFTLFIAKNRRS